MRHLLALTAFVVAFGMVGPQTSTSWADDATRQVEELSSQGAEAFRAGDFPTAIERFEAAYELQAVPNLLYNIGRCYEQLEEWDEAITYFERFITSPDIESEAREHAMERVRSLREIKEATARGEDPDDDDDSTEELPPPPPEPGPNRVPGFAVTGLGVAMIAGGAIAGLSARNQASQISDMSMPYDDRLAARNSARTRGFIADGLFVGGAVATGVGIFLLVTAGSDDGDTARVMLPWVGQESAGLGVHLDF